MKEKIRSEAEAIDVLYEFIEELCDSIRECQAESKLEKAQVVLDSTRLFKRGTGWGRKKIG